MIPELDPEPETTIAKIAEAVAAQNGWLWSTTPEFQRGRFCEQAKRIVAALDHVGLVIVPRGVALAGERWLDERAQGVRDMCPGPVERAAEAAFRDEFGGIPFNRDMDHG